MALRECDHDTVLPSGVQLFNEFVDHWITRRSPHEFSIDCQQFRRPLLIKNEVGELTTEGIKRRFVHWDMFAFQATLEQLGNRLDEIHFSFKVMMQGSAIDANPRRDVAGPKAFEPFSRDGYERRLDDEAASLVWLKSNTSLGFIVVTRACQRYSSSN